MQCPPVAATAALRAVSLAGKVGVHLARPRLVHASVRCLCDVALETQARHAIEGGTRLLRSGADAKRVADGRTRAPEALDHCLSRAPPPHRRQHGEAVNLRDDELPPGRRVRPAAHAFGRVKHAQRGVAEAHAAARISKLEVGTVSVWILPHIVRVGVPTAAEARRLRAHQVAHQRSATAALGAAVAREEAHLFCSSRFVQAVRRCLQLLHDAEGDGEEPRTRGQCARERCTGGFHAMSADHTAVAAKAPRATLRSLARCVSPLAPPLRGRAHPVANEVAEAALPRHPPTCLTLGLGVPAVHLCCSERRPGLPPRGVEHLLGRVRLVGQGGRRQRERAHACRCVP
mmetsp:Transcript_5883/g.23263  ORF Transcript_5883/g.23263 Transcript_5883/m.23263 type:complete len:345 (-) Transcript_5883:483-1517(-)